MGRAWRIEYEGALYHILSRGNEQGDIFYDNTDRRRFLDTIGELSERFEVGVLICPKPCNGLAPHTLDGLITVIIGVGIYFRADLKVSS